MRVLVTGHRGYIGSVLTGVLRAARCEVVGLDCDWYRGCDFGRVREPVPSFDADVRDIEFTDLLAFDAVIHLAAVPEDHEGAIDPRVADEINHAATVRLAECCKQADVPRMIFASTCAVYGSRGDELVDESSPVHPISDYARSKLRCERDLALLADGRFAPVCLRLATAYGVSPRLRIDTVVNDFVASVVSRGRIDAWTGGRAWRPFLHVEDIARAFVAMLLAPDESVSGEVFNVVRTDGNHRVCDVAELACEHVSGATYALRADVEDRRSYRVSGEKLLKAVRGWNWRWTLRDGIRQLREATDNAGMTPAEWRCGRYRRLMRLQTLVERGELSPSLRAKRTALVG